MSEEETPQIINTEVKEEKPKTTKVKVEKKPKKKKGNPDALKKHRESKSKKVSKEAIKMAQEEKEKTRAFQSQYDDRYNVMVFKYNKFTCDNCKFDLSVIGISLISDPETGRKFLHLRKTCKSSCNQRDVIYELDEKSADDENMINIDTYNAYI